MQVNFSSTVSSFSDDIQSHVARSIKKNPEIYQNVAESKAFKNSLNMDSFQKSSIALNDARLSISNTKGYLGYNIFNLKGISNAIKQATFEYKMQHERKPMDPNIETIDELFEMHSEIDDELVISVLQLAETVEKPKDAQDMDDLKWGMLLGLGKEIGMNDKDGLMQITQQDLKIYYDIRHNREQGRLDTMGEYDQNGNLIKQYENPEDVWKDIFLTDSNGDFLRDKAGNLIRNENFTYTTSVQQDNTTFHNDLDWSMYNYDNNIETKISDYQASDLMHFSVFIKDGNDFAFNRLANRYYESVNVGEEPYYIQDLKEAKNDAEKLFVYKRYLVNAYHNLLHDIEGAPTQEEWNNITEKQINNSKWVTFNPYENGSYKNEANKVRKDGYQLQ